MKIDLHLHCSERSSCSISTEKEQIEAAIRSGLDGIAITDHDCFVPPDHLKYLNQLYAPFKIFTGIEVRTKDQGEDFLVYGIYDPALENKNWYYEDLYHFVKKNKGFLVYAHPYRYANYSVADVHTFHPDAVEIHSSNIGRDDEKMLRNLAHQLCCNVVANSDSHHEGSIGIYYNDFTKPIENDAQLVAALHAGQYQTGCQQSLLAQYNAPIAQREALIADYIKQGKTSTDYHKETQNPEEWYHRVVQQRTQQI